MLSSSQFLFKPAITNEHKKSIMFISSTPAFWEFPQIATFPLKYIFSILICKVVCRPIRLFCDRFLHSCCGLIDFEWTNQSGVISGVVNFGLACTIFSRC